MEELRARLTGVNSNAGAQPLPSSRLTYSGEEPSVVKTLSNIYDPKHVSNFARNNVYLLHMSVCAQIENFSPMIASPFNLELHHKSWESAMQGS